MPIRPHQHLIVIPLESQPPLGRRSHRLIRIRRLLITDQNLRVPRPSGRRIRKQLSHTRLLQTHKPKRSLINRLPDLYLSANIPPKTRKKDTHSKQPMILQNSSLPITQRSRDPSPFFPVENHAPEIRVHSMTLVEPQRVLRHHIERLAED